MVGSDSYAFKAAPSNAPTKNGTVILDTATRWHVVTTAAQLGPKNEVMTHEDIDGKKSSVSLCPSQSVSQLGRPRLPEQISAPAPTRSKYFVMESVDQGQPTMPTASTPQELDLSSGNHLVMSPIAARELNRTSQDNTSAASVLAVDYSDFQEHDSPLAHAASQALPMPVDHQLRPAATATRSYANSSSPALTYLTLDLELADGHPQPATREDLAVGRHRLPEDFVPASRLPQHLYEDFWVNDYSEAAYGSVYDGDASVLGDAPSGELDYFHDYALDVPGEYEDVLDHSFTPDWAGDADLGPPLYSDALQPYSTPLLGDEIYAVEPGLDFGHHDGYVNEDADMRDDAAWDPEGIYDVEIPLDAVFEISENVYNEMHDDVPPASDGLLSTADSEPETSLSAAASSPDIFPSSSAAHLLSRNGATLADAENMVSNEWATSARLTRLAGAQTYVAEEMFPTVSKVEEDVARGLRGHWLPQRL